MICIRFSEKRCFSCIIIIVTIVDFDEFVACIMFNDNFSMFGRNTIQVIIDDIEILFTIFSIHVLFFIIKLPFCSIIRATHNILIRLMPYHRYNIYMIFILLFINLWSIKSNIKVSNVYLYNGGGYILLHR
jgi:hypothetical protein